MREVKFRVWDEGLKKMIYFDLKSANDTIDCTIYENIMQFTELKDKSNKEIYGGDIVRWGNKLIGYEVFFKEGKFGIKNTGDPYWKTCEIIGNIYENPELIERVA